MKNKIRPPSSPLRLGGAQASCIRKVGVTLGSAWHLFLTAIGAVAVVIEGVDAVAVAVAVETAMEITVSHGMGREDVVEEEVEEEAEEEAGRGGGGGGYDWRKHLPKGHPQRKCTDCRVKSVPRCNRILNTEKTGGIQGKAK